MHLPPSESSSWAVPSRSSTLTRMRTHISSLFHGTSVHTSGPFTSSSRGLKPACPSEPNPSHGRLDIPQTMAMPPSHFRSPTSACSVIDPASFLASRTRPARADSYLRLITSPALALQSTPASPTIFSTVHREGVYHAQAPSGRRRRHRRRRRHGTWERVQPCAMAKPGLVRRRVYNCLGSGISLVVVLTICGLYSVPILRGPDS